MSAGGINAQTPLPAYPAPVAGAQPIAGRQAGSVLPAGGDVAVPRTVAIAAGVGGQALQHQAAVNAAREQVAGQRVLDTAAAQPTPAAAAVRRGPAAWGEDWAKKFREAGASPEEIQQLSFSGAMGADAAELQQMLEQFTTQVDTQLAKFAHEHPDAYEKVRSNPDVPKSMVVQLAMLSNAGQLPKDQLEMTVDSLGKSQGKMIFDTMIKPMIVWSLIPGWGALRVGFAPFTGGKDILTGEKLFGDPMTTAFTVLGAVGGGMTIYNNVKGAMQVAQGHRMVATAGSDASIIGAREGLDKLTGWQKFKSYVPGTELNQQLAGVSRLDDLKAGIAALSDDVIDGTRFSTRELAQAGYDKLVHGSALIKGEPASKWMMAPIPGYQPNSRGVIVGHIMGKKGATTVATGGARPELMFDLRTVGKVSAANLAADALQLVDDTAANGMLKTRVFGAAGAGNASVLERLRGTVYANASKQIFDAGAATQRTGIAKLLGAIRPDALQDATWAASNVGTSNLGKVHGWHGIPKLGRWGLMGGAAALGGYFMMVKPQLDAAKEAAKQQAEAQGGAAGSAGGQGGAIDPSTMSAEDQAILQQFAAMPAQQQAQIIQSQYAQLQQAMQTPNMTAEQQQQVVAAQAELELLVQVAQGGAAGQAQGGGVQAQAAQPQTAVGAGQPAFTAQGLGLA
jgi:hypothetical protein